MEAFYLIGFMIWAEAMAFWPVIVAAIVVGLVLGLMPPRD